MECTFRQGEDVLMMDYVAGADIAAGQVVLVGGITGIAHRPILNGATGALAIKGGIYQTTGNGAIAAGVKVYWDDAANKASPTAGALKQLGVSTTACAGDGSTFEFEHDYVIV